MVVFALSCFGLLLFLWLSFGGPVPLKPKGYRVTVNFPEATTLAQEADVRVAGVPIGRVAEVYSSLRDSSQRAVIEPFVDFAALDLVGVVVPSGSESDRAVIEADGSIGR